MSDPDRAQDEEADAELEEYEEYEEEPRNPFDNPYFLPVLLAGFALWCGWDGFISTKYLDEPRTLLFNKGMFVLLSALAAWMTFRARREKSADKSG